MEASYYYSPYQVLLASSAIVSIRVLKKMGTLAVATANQKFTKAFRAGSSDLKTSAGLCLEMAFARYVLASTT